MKLIVKLALLVQFSILISCSSNENSKSSNSTLNSDSASVLPIDIKPKEIDSSYSYYKDSTIKFFNDSTFLIERTLQYENYLLKALTTCETDSVYGEEWYLFEPIVLKQKFTFYHKNKILNNVVIPIKKIRQRVNRGPRKEMLGCVFFTADVVKLRNEIVFYVSGYSGCNANCPVCEAVFSLDGRLLASGYGTETEVGNQRKISNYIRKIENGDVLKSIYVYPM